MSLSIRCGRRGLGGQGEQAGEPLLRIISNAQSERHADCTVDPARANAHSPMHHNSKHRDHIDTENI